jgi:hypothetical protein
VIQVQPQGQVLIEREEKITMNSPNGSNPLYGNYQQQVAATQPNQPITSLFMQPSQQSPNNSQQQYEVCQIQPTNLHQT